METDEHEKLENSPVIREGSPESGVPDENDAQTQLIYQLTMWGFWLIVGAHCISSLHAN